MADHDTHDILGNHLAADARPLTPAFSETLHADTMRTLRRQHVRRVLSRPESQWWRVGLAAAASLLVAGSLWWVNDHPQTLDPIPTIALETSPSASIGAPDPHALLRSGAEPLRNAFAQVSTPLNDWGQDAESVVRYLRQQFPSTPRAGAPAAPADGQRM